MNTAREGAIAPSEARTDPGIGLVQHIEAIKKCVATLGIDGLVSLISALVACYSYDRKGLLAFRRHFLPSSHHAIFRELLDLYEGDDVSRHRWTVQSDGTYALLTEHAKAA